MSEPSNLTDLTDFNAPEGNPMADTAAAEPSVTELPSPELLHESPDEPLHEPLPAVLPSRTFEDLSLAELLGRLLSRPASTVSALSNTLSQIATERVRSASTTVHGAAGAWQDDAVARSGGSRSPFDAASRVTLGQINWRTASVLGLMLAAWLIAVAGNLYMLKSGRVRERTDLALGGVMMLIGATVFGVSAARNLPMLRLPMLEKQTGKRLAGIDEFLGRYAWRLGLVGISLLFTAGAWLFSNKNQFTSEGAFCWVISIIGWSVALAPQIISVEALRRAAAWGLHFPSRVISFRISWTLIALTLIVLVGTYFRFNNLEAYPPDMTSDHVEKARDAQMIAEGARPIFLPNNGGREPAHFYLLALMHNLLGLPINFDLLKIATGIEGVLGIIAAWWLGRELIGEENREFGNLTGIIMAALIATSYWHIMLSRLGLRIVLTPLVVSVLLVYFVRALRYNRRVDYVRAGLVLGIGVYCYQAIRMVPVFLVLGFILTLLLRARDLGTLRRYLFNFAALTLIAIIVFVPLGHFMVQYPNDFWSRTYGRLLGDAIIQVKDPATGNITQRDAALTDKLEALRNNLGFFGTNMQTALLMFHWHGDASWITGTPDGTPELDTLTAGLFMLGLGIWIVRLIRRRDPGDWLVPVGLAVMLFPTALSLAYVVEVPSATRASGALPFVYLLAAFAGAVILQQARQTLRGTLPRLGLIAGVAVIALLSTSANYNTYFVKAMTEYRLSTLPHQQAGHILNGFEHSTGAPGNAFMIAYDYWWDHRALAITADDIHWDNGILRDSYIERIIQTIKVHAGTAYAFQPDRQVLFFVNQADQEVMQGLMAWLPNATIEKITTFTPSKDFVIIVAPPVGCDWFEKIIGVGLSPVCDNTPPKPTG